MVIEDLYIIDDKRLIFSAGPSADALNSIRKASYTVEEGVVQLNEAPWLLVQGDSYVRLGNINQHATLVYSERGVGVIGSTVKISSKTAHQPFQYKDDTYYTELTENNLADSICCNNELVFHLEDLNKHLNSKYVETGNPYVVADKIFFEANKNKASFSTWEILVYDLNKKTFERIISKAANPAYYKGKLFYCDMGSGNTVSGFTLRAKDYDIEG
jgi:hypothetical protein